MRGHSDQPPGGGPEPLDTEPEFFEGLVEAMDQAILTVNTDGTIVYATPAIETLLGYEPVDLHGERFAEFAPPQLSERYEDWLQHRHEDEEDDSRSFNGDESFEETWRTADDEEARLTVSVVTHRSDSQQLFSGLLSEAVERGETGEQLREEEALVEEIFDTSPIALAVRDADGKLLRANDRAAKVAGLDSSDLRGTIPRKAEAEIEALNLYDADGEPIADDQQPVERVLRTGDPLYNEEIILERPDGDCITLSVNAAPIYTDGELQRVVTAAEDVTELKHTQHELERRHEELETELSEVFTRIADAFFALNDDWEFTYVNDEAEILLDRREEDLVGKTLWESFSDAVDTRFEREYRRAMESQEPVSFVEQYPPLSAWFEVRAYPSETGLSVYFRDVTERKQREQELQKHIEQQRAIAEFSQRALEAQPLDDLFDEAAEVLSETLDHDYCKVLELHPDEGELLLRNGVGWREGIVGSATVANDYGSQAGYTLASEEPVVVEDLQSEDRFSGPKLLTSHDVVSGISTIIGPLDDPWGILGTHDTSHKSYADHDVQFVQSVAHILATAIRRHEQERELRTSEERYRTLVENFPNGTVLLLDEDLRYVIAGGQIFDEMETSPEDLEGKTIRESLPASVQEVLEPRYRAALDGEPSTFEVEHEGKLFRAQAVPVADADGEVNAAMVVTQDVTERKERKQQLERYETIVETVEDGIYIVGSDETFSMVNSSFAKLVGYEVEELIGTPPSILYDEETKAKARRLQQEILNGDRTAATVEHPLRTGSGDTFPAETKFVVRHTNDGDYERVGVTRDITERKERERELEAQNERLDAFASMLAHELRNPLEIAQIYLDMGVEGNDIDASAFEEVERALDRIEEMIETLLVVTRRGGAVDTTEVVALGESARTWWENIDTEGTLVVETDRNIRADASRLRQLLENLYRNAVEHAGPSVTVRVGDLEDGFYVEDDGPGIPEGERGQVFEPGYSTSNVGIGFGLAVVRQLVEAHGWHCEITESENGGARFEFTGVEIVAE